MLNRTNFSLGAMIALALAAPAGAGELKKSMEAERFGAETGAKLSISPATGTVRFARAAKGKAIARAGAQGRATHALAFLKANGKAFGLRNASGELKLRGVKTDAIGESRVNYGQVYRGIPVFGGSLAVHYSAGGNLKAINGLIVPDISVNPVPSRTAAEAGAVALKQVPGSGVTVRSSRLVVYREGLLKGVPGSNHLAYEVEVGNGKDLREYVYVDAHDGAKLDQITGIQDAIDRRAYNAGGLAAPGPTYPNSPYWVEGDAFPTPSVEANNMLEASKETYDLFYNAFGVDSFDGAGKKMDSIFNRGNACPNASWNGTFISFCPGLTTDDVTAHEWGHAYTQYSHGLIYAWQSGALNESYSDIWGETVDRINGRQTDTPFAARSADGCSIYGGNPPRTFTVNSPASIAGEYFTTGAAFGPTVATATGALVLGNDGVGATADACEALVGFPAGAVALVDRGTCGFAVKVKNAQNAGASAVVVANTAAGAMGTMGGADATITIPSVMVTYASGNLFKANLPANVTLSLPAPSDDSVRWLIGEDSTAPGLVGALRDMWNPRCEGNPGKVSDPEYFCATGDQGGVHYNSGVPNHAYALLVDGGTYNGQTVSAIGLTKAAQIYFRAQSVYQHSASDFADHADAIEQSCSDLIGTDLPDLQTGAASGQVISDADCGQVAKAALAVELRTPPTQCGFLPVLDKDPPTACAAGSAPSYFFSSNFNAGDSTVDRWSTARTEVNPASFTPRDWTLVDALPDGRTGRGFWAPDPNIGTCAPGTTEAGVLHLYSPVIAIAKSVTNPTLSFEHWVATEAGWDGANLKISVNGGGWQTVDYTHFIYNSYNALLYTAAQGNDNPLAGQQAFTGTDGGSVGGSWGRSILDLTPYASAGSKVQLRFDMGTDCGGGSFGWYLDDVKMYTCKRKK